MNIIRPAFTLAVGSLLLLSLPRVHAQSIITEWQFDNLPIGTDLTPAPSAGSGSASSVGMGSTGPSPFPTPGAAGSGDKSDITTQVGTDTDNTGATNQVWRVRGNNGWDSTTAIGTQGAQFLASTAGDSSITAKFDIMITAQGEANFQVQYTSNGTTWINAASLTTAATNATVATNTSNSNIVTGTYVTTTAVGGTDTWFNGINVNLTGISAVNNDPNFGIRVVNATTGSADVALVGGPLNNTSGNWRFDDVAISGTAIPEPSTWALIVGCLVFGATLVRRRCGRQV